MAIATQFHPGLEDHVIVHPRQPMVGPNNSHPILIHKSTCFFPLFAVLFFAFQGSWNKTNKLRILFHQVTHHSSAPSISWGYVTLDFIYCFHGENHDANSKKPWNQTRLQCLRWRFSSKRDPFFRVPIHITNSWKKTHPNWGLSMTSVCQRPASITKSFKCLTAKVPQRIEIRGLKIVQLENLITSNGGRWAILRYFECWTLAWLPFQCGKGALVWWRWATGGGILLWFVLGAEKYCST